MKRRGSSLASVWQCKVKPISVKHTWIAPSISKGTHLLINLGSKYQLLQNYSFWGLFWSVHCVSQMFQFSSVQLSRWVKSDSLQPQGLQHARPPCQSPTPEFTQTHVHWVGDAIQPSHPLSPPSPPTFNLSQHQGLFKWVSSSHQVAKALKFQLQHSPSNEYSGLISFRRDWLNLLAVQGTHKSLPTPQFKSINSLALSFLYSPTLTSIHDYWKSRSLD